MLNWRTLFFPECLIVVSVLVLLHVVKLDMVAEKLLLLIAQWVLDKVTQFVDDSSGVRLHVLVPKKL